jgi:hypothetical protein
VGIRKWNREKKIWEAALSIILVRTFFKSLTIRRATYLKRSPSIQKQPVKKVPNIMIASKPKVNTSLK